ncbi:MAG: hypothetical protein E7439_02565 [Ruminococcaceae bacterium]|nr:hypothetical protein [Oscillospiraceae bacterium]
MTVLILDAKTALMGGTQGLQICLSTVIPSLLPFFFLSILLSSSITGLNIPLLRPTSKLCRIPRDSESIFILGLLGGYPTGAQAVSQAYRAGQLSKTDARRMLGFCSNAGPSFLFGILSPIFPHWWIPWVLWLIHILSALLTGYLLPGGSGDTAHIPPAPKLTVTEALERSIKIMARVCGWIILFRILLAFFGRWFFWPLPQPFPAAIMGVVELANGCMQLPLVSNLGLRMVLCSAFLSFGSLSVLMQTASVTAPLGLGMYLPGKGIQTAISLLLTIPVQSILLSSQEKIAISPLAIGISALFLIFTLLYLKKREKNSSIPAYLGV